MLRALYSVCLVASAAAVCTPTYQGVPNLAPSSDPEAPDSFNVAMYTDAAEPIVLQVTREWSPLGVDRFYQLVKDGYYTCAGFFRVVPDFVLQFGIAALPEETAKWDTTIPGVLFWGRVISFTPLNLVPRR